MGSRSDAPAPAPADGQAASAPATGQIVVLFVGLMLAMFMFSLNQTVLATALPTIVGELNGVDRMLWIQTGFMLASTILMPAYGRLGDQFGRKSFFIAAISIFIGGSFIGFLAPTMDWLIAGRIVQGVGGGGMMILSQAIIASVVPARQRGKYMGIMGSVFAVSSVAGPLIGGWLTEGPGWRWAFLLSLPLGVLAIISTAVFFREDSSTRTGERSVDVIGLALIAVFTSSVVLVSAWGGTQFAWASPEVIGLIAAGVLAAVAFVFVELRVSAPIIPMWLFKDRNFTLASLAGISMSVGMFGVISYMPTYLQMTHELTPANAGLSMIPLMATMLVVGTSVGFLIARTGRYKAYPIAGLFTATVGMILLATLQPDTPVWALMLFLAVFGTGLGLALQQLVLIVQNSFPVRMVGTATASNNYFRQVGGTLGMSLVGTLFTSRLMTNLESGLSAVPGGAGDIGSANSLTPDLVAHLPGPMYDLVVNAYNDALVPLFLWLAPLTLIGGVIACFIEPKPLATTNEPVDTTSLEENGEPAGR
ncbi:drug resistance transporter, EmrB/QacA subfamily [Brevibacterium sp. Mu109]|uniref:MDR family MFS transporter n=1 Tax=Brevibacterium sp. Mu109 TaxID=1255669 RepID=UPI000C5AD984|nr:MDR family MFS transporter [Brevibacterium sp. Mu109]SMX91803.1 drug resistance transporter, EmrB/QacA subfamily [Brevibacterium sp. Mu109]